MSEEKTCDSCQLDPCMKKMMKPIGKGYCQDWEPIKPEPEKKYGKCPCLETTFDACPMVLDLRHQLAEKDKEIEHLKETILNLDHIMSKDTINVKNNLCRCCGLVMTDKEKQTHDCGKKPVIRN